MVHLSWILKAVLRFPGREAGTWTKAEGRAVWASLTRVLCDRSRAAGAAVGVLRLQGRRSLLG